MGGPLMLAVGGGVAVALVALALMFGRAPTPTSGPEIKGGFAGSGARPTRRCDTATRSSATGQCIAFAIGTGVAAGCYRSAASSVNWR